ncbi:membrane protein [Acidobacteria bacterium Mor1]|nr:membrane protein [Acidobacteria bacterium Mor1]
MFTWLKSTLRLVTDSSRDLAFIVLVIAFFQIVVLRQPFPELGRVLGGLVLVVLGLALFVRGLDLGLFPLGESMAYTFARKGSLAWLLVFAFALGFGTTIAEPALALIADEAAEVATQTGVIEDTDSARLEYALGLRLTVALAVGVAIVIGVWRIIAGWPIHIMIAGGYAMVTTMTMFAPAEFIGIAYDSGGITTSTITVPLVTALGVGLASSIEGRNPVMDGFGLIAFASLTPMIFVMIFGILI